MITDEQKVEMFRLRVLGMTYEAIGEKFGVTKQSAYSTLNYVVKGTGRGIARCIYPALSEWCVEHGESFYSLSKKVGMCRNSLYSKIEGKQHFNQPEIDKILTITGLTYEAAFTREENS